MGPRNKCGDDKGAATEDGENHMKTIMTAPPMAEPLSVGEAKLHLRIDGADEDTLISRLIAAARRQVETAAGLVMITQSWSIFLDRWPGGRLTADPLGPPAPVVAIAGAGFRPPGPGQPGPLA